MPTFELEGDWSGFAISIDDGTCIFEWDNSINPLPTWDDVMLQMQNDMLPEGVQAMVDAGLEQFMLDNDLLARTDR